MMSATGRPYRYAETDKFGYQASLTGAGTTARGRGGHFVAVAPNRLARTWRSTMDPSGVLVNTPALLDDEGAASAVDGAGHVRVRREGQHGWGRRVRGRRVVVTLPLNDPEMSPR